MPEAAAGAMMGSWAASVVFTETEASMQTESVSDAAHITLGMASPPQQHTRVTPQPILRPDKEWVPKAERIHYI